MSRAFQVRMQVPRILTPVTAAGLGVSRSAVRHAVRTGRWQNLLDGIVLTTPGPASRLDWARAGLVVAGRGSALSGWDGIRAFGLGASKPPDGHVLVLARSGEHRDRGPLRIRPTKRQYRPVPAYQLPAIYRGLSVVTPARAIADVALVYRLLAPVRALVTSSIQRGVCTPDDLAAELACMPRNGSAHFRRALSDVLDGAHSIAEAEAADALSQGPVPAFEMNVPIINRAGRTIAYADALWRDLRAVLEIDSREFHYEEADWNRTRSRHNRLTTGWLSLQHYAPSEIRADPAAWAAEVAVWLAGRAMELGVPLGPPGGPIRHGKDGPPPFHLP